MTQYPPLQVVGPSIIVLIFGTVAIVKLWRERLLRWIDRMSGGLKSDARAEAEHELEKERQKKNLEEQQRQKQTPFAREDYLIRLEQEMRRMTKIPALGREQPELNLEQVYVPLYVVERKQMERFDAYLLGKLDGQADSRRDAYEAVETSQPVFRLLSEPSAIPRDQRTAPTTTRLLLVGRAGSGKTTTLHYGALMLARAFRQDDVAILRDRLQLFVERCPFPIYARLTELMTYVRGRYTSADLVGVPATVVIDALDELLRRDVPDLPVGMVRDWVQNRDTPCLLMFDGLDETGDADERGHTIDLINSLVRAYPQHRYLLASRPFEGLSDRLAGFTERHLRPLDANDIKRLLNNFFLALRLANSAADAPPNPDELVPEAAELWRSLERNPRLFDMVTNPLLLTSMAVLVEGREPLPVERVKIYEKLVRLTIEAWRRAQLSRDRPGVTVKLFEESDDSVRLRLQLLAAHMLERKQREVTLAQVRELLRPIYRSYYPDWHDERCDTYIRDLFVQLALHSGLVHARDIDTLFSFAHFTLQEYLVARHYTEQGRDKEKKVNDLIDRWSERRWRETILLAIGHEATIGSHEMAQTMIDRLRETGDPEALLLAGEALDEANARTVGELTRQRLAVADQLRTLAGLTADWCTAMHPDPVVRNRAAIMLDRVDADHDRAGLDLTQPAYWAARIEPGAFSMGGNNVAHKDEQPQFICHIRQPYALARFPVTNRQYLRFLDALAGRGGREEVAAAEAVRHLLQQYGLSPDQMSPRSWPGTRYRMGEGNCPVVGITWYAATAFAHWVDIWLHKIGVLHEWETVRLPTEAEWERAAAYPVVIPAANPRAGRREYPWGDWSELPAAPVIRSAVSRRKNGDEDRYRIRANTFESSINQPSVVGIFPHGAAACGAEDMAGNVWEWCSTLYLSYPLGDELEAESLHKRTKDAKYVLRGGSWYYDRDNARCAYRLPNPPDHDRGNWGVRLARTFSSS
ncbi:NACHT domain-containing protein [Chloroflexus sp.]|uniref:NACHT domain-containing protein n=1 Tax=Chloroflexus sp. TaxID=1904827 RepID=UPI002ADDD736|nr:SUMF1/EgtB/PvdO family nonheme iron enzyme [Chloroflexus sp.]